MPGYSILLKEFELESRLVGAISALYDIPLEEIKELKKTLRQEQKIDEMIRIEREKAAKKKFDKLKPRFRVLQGQGTPNH